VTKYKCLTLKAGFKADANGIISGTLRYDIRAFIIYFAHQVWWAQTHSTQYTIITRNPSLATPSSAVACPDNTAGTNVPVGDCDPDPGYYGTVSATIQDPYFAIDGIIDAAMAVCDDDVGKCGCAEATAISSPLSCSCKSGYKVRLDCSRKVIDIFLTRSDTLR
jgi:hypothetical protein